jgi:hypothetical protein
MRDLKTIVSWRRSTLFMRAFLNLLAPEYRPILRLETGMGFVVQTETYFNLIEYLFAPKN